MKDKTKYNYKKVMITFNMNKKMHVELIDFIKYYCEEEQINVSQAIRKMIKLQKGNDNK